METNRTKVSKSQIRRTILQMRDHLSPRERERGNLLLTERILGHPWFCGAEHVLCFASYGSEIDTREILRGALGQGKKVYVPKVLGTGETSEMTFYRIQALEELAEGYRGIPEPAGDSEEYVYGQEIARHTLMLMPGVVFDGFCNRLGYGKGFYDRYLADKEELRLRTIAVGYRCQLVEELPSEEMDIKPCQVICV